MKLITLTTSFRIISSCRLMDLPHMCHPITAMKARTTPVSHEMSSWCNDRRSPLPASEPPMTEANGNLFVLDAGEEKEVEDDEREVIVIVTT
jgi:hypothetical protein